MTKNEKDRLCAGTFFTLLSNARYAQPTHAERYAGVFSDISEPWLLYALGRVTRPGLKKPMKSEIKTLKDNAGDLKSGTNLGGNFCEFKSLAVQAAFTERIKASYAIPLQAMCELVDHFIETNTDAKKDEYLVKALVEVIANDDKISDNQEFYVCGEGSTWTKDDICGAKAICIQPFLLGVWHYVLTEVDNKVGADTYSRWCPPRNQAPRDYVAGIGEKSKRKIKIIYCSEPDLKEPVDVDESPEPEIPYVEPEVMDQEQTVQEAMGRNVVFNFIQNGNGNTQIGSITNYYAGTREEK